MQCICTVNGKCTARSIQITSFTIVSKFKLENRNKVRISETQDINVILIIVTIV